MTSPFVPLYRQFPTADEQNLERQLVNFHVQTNTAVNNRTIGTFDLNSIPNGERWYPTNPGGPQRDGNRKVLTFSSILNGATTIPHGITYTKITRLYGTADNGTTTIPLEHSTSTEVVSLTANATNVIITTTTANWTAYSGTIVLEYI